ncbi:hypothetical protein AAG570_002085 [Ranatra chinensis]|uniref:Uncharacterized protein n=1 Tax=Ranatra chinensis TaxID=642074 RepID=A0ABD0YM76_9HEMI
MTTPDKQPQGHVKLELEVTLTPEVDSQQVSSTVEQGGSGDGVTVIPPTTIVCLPGAAPPPQPPPPPLPPASSSALPYLALTTSTPVRALPTKTITKGNAGGRGGRNSNSKPPPGAVNLERSYQICQAVIQNSPNRDQLRCQLKPPPSLLKHQQPPQHPPPPPPRPPVLLRHVFTSHGIPVNMAVLPNSPQHHPSQVIYLIKFK